MSRVFIVRRLLFVRWNILQNFRTRNFHFSIWTLCICCLFPIFITTKSNIDHETNFKCSQHFWRNNFFSHFLFLMWEKFFSEGPVARLVVPKAEFIWALRETYMMIFRKAKMVKNRQFLSSNFLILRNKRFPLFK